MRVLVHICCAPCFTYLHKKLCDDGYDVIGYWYNPNIHPYTEYKTRLHTLQRYTALCSVDVIYDYDYPLVTFLKNQIDCMVTPDTDVGEKDVLIGKRNVRDERCGFCIRHRLEKTAKTAVVRNFNAYTTTLLLSKYQPHEAIKRIGMDLGKKYGIPFYYEDFRKGWKESIKLSKELELYRQGYCGCIFSEFERYSSNQNR